MTGNAIQRLFIAWGKIPWRKPVAMLWNITALCLIVASFGLQWDLPERCAGVLEWGTVFTNGLAYGTSTLEALKPPKRGHVDERHE